MSAIILVIDDNPELVDGVKLTLEMEGYQVLTANSGGQALEILERITPDLILADIMMPEMDGYELYQRVHADSRWLHVPFIFLTAKTDKADIRLGKEMGADDYITKPFDPQDVVAAVRGRLKRMAEVIGQPVRGDVVGGIKYLWKSRVGPIPVPAIAFAVLALVIAVTVLAVMRLVPRQEFTSPLAEPLRPDVGEMIAIPAGEFLMGSDKPGAPRPRQVTLPDYQIDRYEATNGQYQVFVAETGHPAPESIYTVGMEDYPVVGVKWEDARAYCEWAGKRLPNEAEWEKAASGTEDLIYPWGDDWRDGVTNTSESGIGGIKPVGSFPEGASPYGVLDMAGNVWEWVDDWANSAQETRVIRGGAWDTIGRWAQTFARNEARPTYTSGDLGFRCAR